MGLIPGAGGTVSITCRIGRPRTTYFALTGRRIDATTTQHWGLVDLVDTSTSERGPDAQPANAPVHGACP